jgi:microcin C transport system permease protein
VGAYVLRRVALIIPTLFGIMLINFVVIQFAPGGPVEQVIAELTAVGGGATERFSGGGADVTGGAAGASGGEGSGYRGAQGLDPAFIAQIEKQFGFDRPPAERFLLMLWNYLRFEFGDSYFRSASVVELIIQKMPVSITLGLWTTLLAYAVSIPLGIAKAVRDGSRFDVWTSGVVIIGYAIPGFLFAILLRTLFAEGSGFFPMFPLRGLSSGNWADLSVWGKVVDYFWHIALPISAMAISGFAVLTLLTKNSFLDQIKLQYVATARAKGLSETRVLYGHVFRNAMLIVIAGFPAAFISILFTGSLLIEVIFSLDGLGLLGYEAVLNRDYPIVFGTLYIFGLIGLLLQLVTDLVYVWVDPRIDFESREA